MLGAIHRVREREKTLKSPLVIEHCEYKVTTNSTEREKKFMSSNEVYANILTIS